MYSSSEVYFPAGSSFLQTSWLCIDCSGCVTHLRLNISIFGFGRHLFIFSSVVQTASAHISDITWITSQIIFKGTVWDSGKWCLFTFWLRVKCKDRYHLIAWAILACRMQAVLQTFAAQKLLIIALTCSFMDLESMVFWLVICQNESLRLPAATYLRLAQRLKTGNRLLGSNSVNKLYLQALWSSLFKSQFV